MSRFLQMHLLTFVPPANLNRDDTGRPKTAVVGGATRLRLSSQALKRAWRTSEVFATALKDHMGLRTQRLGELIEQGLIAEGVAADRALAAARAVAGAFGKLRGEDKNTARIEQLAFIAPEEREAAFALARRYASGDLPLPDQAKTKGEGKSTTKEGGKEDTLLSPALKLLRDSDTAADIALFGRMLADNPAFNREAAAQVAHAITTHRVVVEDDFYTAVDDLKQPAEDAGAGFIGEAAFGSGVFYLYLSINRDLLIRNLGGGAAGTDLADKAIAALIEAAATTAPSGKQNSFAAHARAGYILAEKGDAQPRTLAGAFAKPVEGMDLLPASIAALQTFREALDKAYGPAAQASAELQVGSHGSLTEILAFARGAA